MYVHNYVFIYGLSEIKIIVILLLVSFESLRSLMSYLQKNYKYNFNNTNYIEVDDKCKSET